MKNSIEETLRNKSRFSTYTLAIATLVKSIAVLQARGANPKAVSFFLHGLDMLVNQLKEGARSLEVKQTVEKFLEELKVNQEREKEEK